MSRKLFMDAVVRANASGEAVFGTGTSIACRELMDEVGAHFPEAHLEAAKMAELAAAGHTVLGLGKTRGIIERLTEVTLAFGRAQIDAGADCLLLGDHATRDLCSPAAYAEFLQDVHDRVARELDVPVILHICGDTSDRIGMIARTAVACFHWDTKTGRPETVRELAGSELALMGGISNYWLLDATPAEIAADAAAAAKGDTDIVGPECAVPLGTPLANLKAIAGAGCNP
ncbi:hypothetical protein LCGC14_2274960 [marine sediment metagenome]|uniref:Uroporphyrinogen decarboxylase (URO-D) domain-containing protein n=1 Tax=marine sediment metagenome TaxID=412755 RepID=A0A0F9F8C9_9ZZZZ